MKQKSVILIIGVTDFCSFYNYLSIVIIFILKQPENPWSLDRGMNGVIFAYILLKCLYILKVYAIINIWKISKSTERRKSMYLTVKQQVKHLSKEDYRTIKELCHAAKNLANEAIYNVRQYYFAEGEFLK